MLKLYFAPFLCAWSIGLLLRRAAFRTMKPYPPTRFEQQMTDIQLRRATPDDAAAITLHRRRMFEDMGIRHPGMDAMDAAFLPWVTERLASGAYEGWLACTPDGEVIGGAGLIFLVWIPTFNNLEAQRPYILNVYVRPDFRRRGIAERLVRAILDEVKARGGARVWLHASEQGRPIYTRMGFALTNEMRIEIE
jgi:GNAT superfamily N-acetyltransferase